MILKKTILILLSLIGAINVFSAINFPTPRYLITVSDQNTIKVDSFFIIEDGENHQYIANNYSSKDLLAEQKARIFSNKFKLKVKLTNSTYIYSEPVLIKDKYTQYEFIVKNNKVEINKLRGDYYLHIAKSILFFVIVSFIFKVLIFMLKFEIKNKIIYTLKYTSLNLIYCLLFLFLTKELINISILLSPIISIIIICFTETWLHKHDKNVFNKNVYNTILIVNGLFYTVGMFVFIIFSLFFDLKFQL